MTIFTDIEQANERIEQLERMLMTYQALDPVEALAGEELRSLRRRVAIAEAELREYKPKTALRTTASDIVTTALHHIDGNAKNNDLSNLKRVAASGNRARGYVVDEYWEYDAAGRTVVFPKWQWDMLNK